MAADDERWMLRALLLASRSLGCTWPNPGVGCVIVRDGVMLGSGRHEVCGQEHAEVRAIADVKKRGHATAGATVYVTLAPCTRVARQGACCNALAAARISRVVAAIRDPNQDDAESALRSHRIAYQVGCLEDLALRVHGGFLSRVRQGRPRITGKWAMTLDGFLASSGGAAAWISSPQALEVSRRRRRVFDAILIGAGTARRDNPQLLARPARRHGADGGPLRVVVSQQAELRGDSQLVASLPQAPLLMIHGPRVPESRRGELRRLGVQVRAVDDAHDPTQVVRLLGELGVNDLLVEGGGMVHAAFLKAALYDRLELYLGLKSLGGGISVAAGEAGVASPALGAQWTLEEPARQCGSTIALRLSRPAT
jgi:diaminohydroxyphosphoribosylaminopyrimidine deaminase/5-amino-6-(5-phosphoribosylamino)uracil reductase